MWILLLFVSVVSPSLAQASAPACADLFSATPTPPATLRQEILQNLQTDRDALNVVIEKGLNSLERKLLTPSERVTFRAVLRDLGQLRVGADYTIKDGRAEGAKIDALATKLKTLEAFSSPKKGVYDIVDEKAALSGALLTWEGARARYKDSRHVLLFAIARNLDRGPEGAWLQQTSIFHQHRADYLELVHLMRSLDISPSDFEVMRRQAFAKVLGEAGWTPQIFEAFKNFRAEASKFLMVDADKMSSLVSRVRLLMQDSRSLFRPNLDNERIEDVLLKKQESDARLLASLVTSLGTLDPYQRPPGLKDLDAVTDIEDSLRSSRNVVDIRILKMMWRDLGF